MTHNFFLFYKNFFSFFYLPSTINSNCHTFPYIKEEEDILTKLELSTSSIMKVCTIIDIKIFQF